MASISVIKLKIRRGTDNQRQQVILDTGELGWTTDSNRLFVGDGTTKGGKSASTKLVIGQMASATFITAQNNDIVYNTLDSRMYALTGTTVLGAPDYSNTGAYQYIGPNFDNSSIKANTSNVIYAEMLGQNGLNLPQATSTPAGYAGTGKLWIDVTGNNNILKVAL